LAQKSALLAVLDRPDGHYGVSLGTDGHERLLTWMDTYAQRVGHFSDEQEQALLEFRRACAGMLIERPAKTTAALRPPEPSH
jgi:hypothetical protein